MMLRDRREAVFLFEQSWSQTGRKLLSNRPAQPSCHCEREACCRRDETVKPAARGVMRTCSGQGMEPDGTKAPHNVPPNPSATASESRAVVAMRR